jgi:hypothetical protein
MDIFGGLKDLVLGGENPIKTIIDTVKEYVPSDEKKLEMQLKVSDQVNAYNLKVMEAANESERLFNEKLAQYEGTAADLKALPIVGPLMLFVRGSIRPVFCLFTLYLDYMVMSGQWDTHTDQFKGNVFIIMNVLVLGFHFGERALQNVMPLITNLVQVKNGK